MRPPVDTILAPAFPKGMRWIRPPAAAPAAETAPATKALLVVFWDIFQPSSLRAFPYLRAWHERYAGRGLRVVAVHAPSDERGRDEDAVAAAVATLAPPFEVLLDTGFALWKAYENPGWPARYILAPGLRLVDVHFGEGDYEGAERALQELLGIDEPLLPPARATERADAMLVVPTADQDGAYCGAYAAGEVWVVVTAAGTIAVNGVERELDRFGAHCVVAHDAHAEGELDLSPLPGVEVLRTMFAPGLAG